MTLNLLKFLGKLEQVDAYSFKCFNVFLYVTTEDTKWNLPTKTAKTLSINRYTSCVPESYCYYMLTFFFSVNLCNKFHAKFWNRGIKYK